MRIFLFLLPVGLLCSLVSAAERRLPNIVFIMGDDLGYGDIGCYGQQQIQTPHIDQLAADGIRFTNYYAGSTVCAPSRCVLMTGLHTGHARIRGNAAIELSPEDQTVAELLKSAGYATGMFGKWGLGDEGGTGLPTRQGFDEFVGYLNQVHAHNYYPTFLIRGERRSPLRNVVPDAKKNGAGVASFRADYSPDVIREAALKFVDDVHDRPFFLYYPSTLPHANNEAKEAGMEIPDLGPYADKDWPPPPKGTAAMISRLDTDVGELLKKLQQYQLEQETIVFFTSDNGPHREGGNDPEFFRSSGGLKGIKRSMHDGGIRVPLIVRWPGKISPGSVTDQVAYHGDLLATLCEICQIPQPPNLDSISYAPTLLGQPTRQQQHKFLYWEFYERGFQQAVRSGNWKFILQDGEGRLYDLQQDPHEENNVARQHPGTVKQLSEFAASAHVPDPNWTVKRRQSGFK
ncbi:arylsulfatase [Planctomicrobium sp. SH664]|uniref:arylsulfatase n=1 Tax=Planctomicrobium sp. SH664 TaxID=3448125 RepID=UPI003F5BF746